jgi:hypothetical protein
LRSDNGHVPDLAAIVLVLVVLVAIASVMIVVVRRRRSTKSGPDRQVRISAPLTLTEERSKPAEAGDQYAGEVIALPTERPNEIFFFGPTAELDEYGATLATSPPQLAWHAAGLRAGVDAARSYTELSGRLVLVDDKTAVALKSGMMMRDKSGEILAKVLRDDGKISSVTRLREVGGLAAGAASLTNAMSAMAMQAQLDRIERQLSAIADGIDKANRELLREWHAQTLGAQDVLREVYSTATRAGELTPSNWSQVASIGHVVRTQINGDRHRLADAVADLERLALAADVKRRMNELDSKVDAVRSAHAALSESTRTWAQYSTLRLWHFTVTDDPTIGAYRHELQMFIESSREEIEPLRIRASNALQQVNQYRWTSVVRHPLIVRQLPAASAIRLAKLENVNWQPLELQQPSNEIELTVEGEGEHE